MDKHLYTMSEAKEHEKTRLEIFKTIVQCNSDIAKKLEGIDNSNGIYISPNSTINITGDFSMGVPATSSADTSNGSVTFSNFTPNPKPVKTRKRRNNGK